MRDCRTMTPSSRRSTAISRSNQSTLRKPGRSNTAAALPSILRLPKYDPFSGSLSLSIGIDRLSLLKKGPNAFVEIVRATAQDLVAILHRNHRFERSRIGAHVEAFLGEPQRQGRRRHHGFNVRFGRSRKAVFVDDFRDEAHGERAFGDDEPPREDQL